MAPCISSWLLPGKQRGILQHCVPWAPQTRMGSYSSHLIGEMTMTVPIQLALGLGSAQRMHEYRMPGASLACVSANPNLSSRKDMKSTFMP